MSGDDDDDDDDDLEDDDDDDDDRDDEDDDDEEDGDDDDDEEDGDDDDDDANNDDDQRRWDGIIHSFSPSDWDTNDWDIIASDLYGLDARNRPYFFEATLKVTSDCVRASEDYINFHDPIKRFGEIFDDFDRDTDELTSPLLENGGVVIIKFMVHSPEDVCWRYHKNQVIIITPLLPETLEKRRQAALPEEERHSLLFDIENRKRILWDYPQETDDLTLGLGLGLKKKTRDDKGGDKKRSKGHVLQAKVSKPNFFWDTEKTNIFLEKLIESRVKDDCKLKSLTKELSNTVLKGLQTISKKKFKNCSVKKLQNKFKTLKTVYAKKIQKSNMKKSGSAADDIDSDGEFPYSDLMEQLCKDSITKMGNVQNIGDRRNMYNNSISSNTAFGTPMKSPTYSNSNSNRSSSSNSNRSSFIISSKNSRSSSTDGRNGSSASKSDLGMTISGENANHRPGPPRLTKKEEFNKSLTDTLSIIATSLKTDPKREDTDTMATTMATTMTSRKKIMCFIVSDKKLLEKYTSNITIYQKKLLDMVFCDNLWDDIELLKDGNLELLYSTFDSIFVV